jgi:hypothetical protein
VLTAGPMTGAIAPGASGVTARAAAGGTARTSAVVTVAPVVACGQLASDDFSNVPGAPTVILSATQGSGVCHLAGYIAPQERFQLNLPVSGYTGQHLQQGRGGLRLGLPGFRGSGSLNGSAAPAAASCTAVTAAAAASGAMAARACRAGAGHTEAGVWPMANCASPLGTRRPEEKRYGISPAEASA